MQLTKRQSEAVEVIKAAGEKGIGFAALKKKLGIKGVSTLRGRLGQLTKLNAVKSIRTGKLATYFAAG
jgi:predicted transcriptional regulator